MRVPGAAGHQQHRFMLQLTQGIGHVQRIGHHHQAMPVAQLRNHRRRGGAAVDDDPCVLANAADRGGGNRLLPGRHRLHAVADQLLRQLHRSAVAAQQQAVLLECGEILADGDFRGFEAPRQLIHTDLAAIVEQGEDRVATLWGVALRHVYVSIRKITARIKT